VSTFEQRQAAGRLRLEIQGKTVKRSANSGSSTFSASGFDGRASHSTTARYANGQAIYSQGDAADAIFRVEDGNVKLTVRSKAGKKAVIAVLRAGECFGEGCLIGSSQRKCTASSIQRSTIARISRQTVVRRLRHEPALAKLFIAHLLLRVGRVEDDLVDQLMNSSEQRLARLLLQLCAFGGPGRRAPALIHVDQGTLAQVVGTTRSRVSYFMNRFRKKGLIDYNGSLQVHKALLTFLARRQRPA
jgi:CRP/FNR family cyclic AMP-dependent transcriptional regulator